MSYKIITHNGKAHLDELYAIALLAIAKNELPDEIKRINQNRAEELVLKGEYEENTYFVDCGMEFNITKGIFDHHQDIKLESSAKLVLDTFLSELIDTPIDDFIQLVSLVDTKGPKALEGFLERSETLSYLIFTQQLILRQFEKNSINVIEIITNGLKDQIEFEDLKNKGRIWLKSNIQISTINDLKVLEYITPPPEELVKAVKAVDGEIIDNESIDLIYSFDSEDNTIRSLIRTFNGDEKLNLKKSNPKNKIFAHNSGFLLKFIPISENEWLKLLEESRN